MTVGGRGGHYITIALEKKNPKIITACGPDEKQCGCLAGLFILNSLSLPKVNGIHEKKIVP